MTEDEMAGCLDFFELRQVLSTYNGDFRDLFWWPQERPDPMRVARGPLGKQINTFPQVRPLRAETSEPPLFHQTGPGADKQEVLNKRLPSQKDVSYIQSQLHGYGGVRLIIIHSGSTRTPLSHSWTLEPYARYL